MCVYVCWFEWDVTFLCCDSSSDLHTVQEVITLQFTFKIKKIHFC